MSELNALEELRTLSMVRMDGWLRMDTQKIADEIEAEISERYMLLPVDADGVPIRVGDEIGCSANGYEGTFTVFAIGDGTIVGNHDIEWIRNNPSKWFHVASYCRHVKPDPLKELLEELVSEARQDSRDFSVEPWCDAVRELMGGDAS